ncbi:hypothetical protein GJW-30_1_02544 [Variibacter gotjawalensis]|uniref:Glycosyltransferase RgtA/B/C/D-like domain-containing protein n=2 Tax=Variibacter gotjawalensis TaxID=1333996 RepID=A0A0S3PVP4_9BRAD|nr:hypothetical protein EV661_0148 [Variibacter gotjawalensis]BAT60009.1 hypothetical protein GJW-30_1_02544 [Variibacter gotjawalensis]
MSTDLIDRPSSISRWLLGVSLVCLIAAILFGWLLPVYTDEVGWRFLRRAAIDGADSLLNDSCGPTSFATPPWFIMPMRYFSAIANDVLAAPIFVRAAGVVCALVSIGLFWRLVQQLEAEPEQSRLTAALVFALLTAGVLPLVLVMSRPEQILVLTSALIVLTSLARFPQLNSARAAWCKMLLIVALSIVAQSYHLKGVVYVLIALGSLLVSSRGKGTVLPRTLGALLLVASAAVSAVYWSGRFQCPNDPILFEMFASESIFVTFLQQNGFSAFVLQLLKGANPLNYVALAVPVEPPMSHWLPPNRVAPVLHTPLFLAICLIWAFATIIAIAFLIAFVVRRGLLAFGDTRVVIAVSVAAVIAAWGASQLNRNVYEAAHVLPMLAIFIVICWSLRTTDRISVYARGLTFIAVPIAIVTQAFVMWAYAVPLARANTTPGYAAGQPYSVSIAGRREIELNISEAMAASGMPKGRRLNRLVIDDLTYLVLQDSYRPLHFTGIFGPWEGTIKDPIAYLIDRDSDGIVVGCRYLPPRLREAAAKSGPICAISREGMTRLAAAAAAK